MFKMFAFALTFFFFKEQDEPDQEVPLSQINAADVRNSVGQPLDVSNASTTVRSRHHDDLINPEDLDSSYSSSVRENYAACLASYRRNEYSADHSAFMNFLSDGIRDMSWAHTRHPGQAAAAGSSDESDCSSDRLVEPPNSTSLSDRLRDFSSWRSSSRRDSGSSDDSDSFRPASTSSPNNTFRTADETLTEEVCINILYFVSSLFKLFLSLQVVAPATPPVPTARVAPLAPVRVAPALPGGDGSDIPLPTVRRSTRPFAGTTRRFEDYFRPARRGQH
jgi:hypothetical protein